MKKLSILLFAGITFSSAFTHSQSGSNASDFTVTDINGNSHTLSDYLSQGKSVILDIFATWCVPCQNLVPTLESIYSDYGPSGTNELQILSLESDLNTTDEANYASTFGVTNPIAPLTNYVIPTNYNWSQSYPAIIVICSDGSWTTIPNGSTIEQDIRSELSNCGIVGLEENNEESLEVKLFPNPYSSDCESSPKLKLTLLAETNITVNLFDLAGNQLSSEKFELPVGENTVPLNSIGNLSSGMYVVDVSNEENDRFNRMLLTVE